MAISSKGIRRAYWSIALGLAGQEFTALYVGRGREGREGDRRGRDKEHTKQYGQGEGNVTTLLHIIMFIVCRGRAQADLMVPVGDGMGDTKGEVRVVSILRGWMGEMGGGRRGGTSSMREVSASLIWVDGKRMMQLERKRGKRRGKKNHASF